MTNKGKQRVMRSFILGGAHLPPVAPPFAPHSRPRRHENPEERRNGTSPLFPHPLPVTTREQDTQPRGTRDGQG